MSKRGPIFILATVVLFAAAAVVLSGPTKSPGLPGDASPNKVLPPNAHTHGKTLAQWLEGYWRWNYNGSTDVSQPFQPGPSPVVYMPMPVGAQTGGSWLPDDPAYLQGQIEVTLKPGTAFVLPCFAWISERYNTGQADDPSIPNTLIRNTITGVDGTGVPEVTLDGKPILKDFWDYYVGPLAFDPVVEYAQPSSYGSIAAIAFQSTGFVMAPLPPGKHTLHLVERMTILPEDLPGFPYDYYLGLIYDNTWIITVK